MNFRPEILVGRGAEGMAAAGPDRLSVESHLFYLGTIGYMVFHEYRMAAILIHDPAMHGLALLNHGEKCGNFSFFTFYFLEEFQQLAQSQYGQSCRHNRRDHAVSCNNDILREQGKIRGAVQDDGIIFTGKRFEQVVKNETVFFRFAPFLRRCRGF